MRFWLDLQIKLSICIQSGGGCNSDSWPDLFESVQKRAFGGLAVLVTLNLCSLAVGRKSLFETGGRGAELQAGAQMGEKRLCCTAIGPLERDPARVFIALTVPSCMVPTPRQRAISTSFPLRPASMLTSVTQMDIWTLAVLSQRKRERLRKREREKESEGDPGERAWSPPSLWDLKTSLCRPTLHNSDIKKKFSNCAIPARNKISFIKSH